MAKKKSKPKVNQAFETRSGALYGFDRCHQKPNGRSVAKAKVAAGMLAVSVLFTGSLPACTSGQSLPVQAAQARSAARVGYSAAAMALTLLNDVHHAWQKSRTEPTKAELEADEKILAAFDGAKAALTAVKPWLEKGDGGDAAKQKLLEALDLALLGAGELWRAGGKVPPEVTEGIMAVRALIGGEP